MKHDPNRSYSILSLPGVIHGPFARGTVSVLFYPLVYARVISQKYQGVTSPFGGLLNVTLRGWNLTIIVTMTIENNFFLHIAWLKFLNFYPPSPDFLQVEFSTNSRRNEI